MILLLDIGNTHTHVGLANGKGVVRVRDFSTAAVRSGDAAEELARFVGRSRASLAGAALASVVPAATEPARQLVAALTTGLTIQLTPESLRGVGLDYPRPATIGQDRLANAIAARLHFGAPSVVVDFGTAVTFDVVSKAGAYVGGIIAPGLASMTDYLHEKTALLPRIRIREPRAVIGRNTEEAMLVGAVVGYRGLVRELIRELKRELKARSLPVIATGGYAALMAKGLPEITAVQPNLTLEGLRILWEAHASELRAAGKKV
jgi:type III pantothenate kinase